MTDTAALVGPALARLRERRGVDADEMARRVGIHPSGIYKLEKRGSNPQAARIALYLDKLGASTAEFAAELDRLCGRESFVPQAEPLQREAISTARRIIPGAPQEALEQYARLSARVEQLSDELVALETRYRQPPG